MNLCDLKFDVAESSHRAALYLLKVLDEPVLGCR